MLNSDTGFELILFSEVQGFAFGSETGVFLTETTQLIFNKDEKLFIVRSQLGQFYHGSTLYHATDGSEN
jgi:hypothetical protein